MASRGGRGQRLGVGFAACALGVGALAACGSNKYQYVSNNAEQAFFKVPSDWETFDLTESVKEGRVAAVPVGPQQTWLVGFDAAAEPDVAHLDDLNVDALAGVALTYYLPLSDRDTMSQSKLRAFVFNGTDPLLQDPGLPPQWESVSYAPIVGSDGAVGSRLVINVPVDAARTQWVTIDGSTLFDPTTQRMHVLRIHCSAQCYEQYRGAADDIAASWKVNP